MELYVVHKFRFFAAIALNVIAFPAHAEDEQEKIDIVVEKKRDVKVLKKGKWLVKLSRAYHFGDSLDGTNVPISTGSDKHWRFCLPDVSVESFIRLLVGDGLTKTAGTTHRRRLQVKLGEGTLRATQACSGGSVTSPSTVGGAARTDATRVALTVTGHYDATAVKLEFESRRERLTPPLEIGTTVGKPIDKPDILRWKISGERKSDCAPSDSPTKPKP